MKTSTLLSRCIIALNLLVWPVEAGTLDQEYIPGLPANGLIIEQSQTVAQTFQVGLTGVLDRIDLDLFRYAGQVGGMTLEVRSTLPDGRPTTAVLASTFIPFADLPASPQFMSFDIRPFQLLVTEGDIFALVLSSAEYMGSAWSGDGPGNYGRGNTYFDRGSGFLKLSWSMGFRTYVDTPVVPEPTALPLFVVAAAMFLDGRRRSLLKGQHSLAGGPSCRTRRF